MKRFFALIVLIALAVSISGCGKNSDLSAHSPMHTSSLPSVKADLSLPSPSASANAEGNSHLSEAQESIASILNGKQSETEIDDFVLPSDIEVKADAFNSSQDVVFSLFMTMQQIPRSYGWLFTQTHNPEVTFDADSQELEQAFFYLSLYENVDALSRDELKVKIEECVDTICKVIPRVYPNLSIQKIVFAWQLPSINEESLYGAMYFCENCNGEIIRGDGSGLLYE